jgi:hypothetical protein
MEVDNACTCHMKITMFLARFIRATLQCAFNSPVQTMKMCEVNRQIVVYHKCIFITFMFTLPCSI